MSLQLILGNSGAGKSYTLYSTILEEAKKHPKKTYLVIVPEQFTMQTQKELVALSPSHVLMNIDILSFQRLAYRIFEEVGKQQQPVLEETGKTLVLQRVIQEKAKELGILSSSLKKQGTVNEMKSLVSELMQYDIRPAAMDEMCKKSEKKPVLAYKLKDVQIIYQGFADYLKERYLAPEEILDVLCDFIDESRLMKDAEVVLDGFTGFTPIQNKLMRKILKLAKRVRVTITMDEAASREKMKSPQHLFHMSSVMRESLVTLAKEEHVPIEPEYWVHPGKMSRFSNASALSYLERHLFRFGNHRYEQAQEEIQIFAASNPKEEMEAIAQRIRRMVRENGYRYGDFAVITGDLPTYGAYARQVMKDCQVPCFVDEKHSIMMNPFVEYLCAVLNMLTEQFTYESVFRYLRCGLSGLSVDEVDELENYCIAVGVRGWKQWNEHWVRRYRGMEEGSIEELNRIRECFVEEVQGLKEAMEGRTISVEERTRALYHFICKGQIEQKLREKELFFKERLQLDLEKEYAQIYAAIMDLLDKMVQILGQEKITLADYQQLLEAGLSEAKVGIIPPNADQVLVGDMERTRLKDIRVLFFAGVNDSVIPKRKGSGGILSEADRDFLEEQQVELAPNARETMYVQRFSLYRNLTKPSDRLILSYAKASGQGQALSPAYLISSICRLFPGIAVEDSSTAGIREAEQPSMAQQFLLDGFYTARSREMPGEWKELLSWYLRSSSWETLCRQWIEQIYRAKPEDYIGKKAARALYSTTLEGSTTQLERFAACAFAHFLQYGLEIQERQEYEFKAVDMGNVIHQALEQFSKNLKKYRLSWRELDEQTRDKLIDESVEEMIHDYGNTILESSERNRYMILRVKRILRRTVWALQKQLQNGKYEPNRFEISFSMEEDLEAIHFRLSEDEKLRLRGRIDRVDRYEEEDIIYVKVIDYKSGSTSMDLIALYYGLQLQLVVYMNAAVEWEQRNHPEKRVEPAGIFYYQVKDPMAEGSLEESEEELEQKLLTQLRVNGLVRSDEKIIKDMDETLGPGKKSWVIPVAYNKNGSLSRYSQIADKEQFDALSTYVNRKILELGREILNGNVKLAPYKMKKRTACDYCSYRKVCGFDEKSPGYDYRQLPSFADEELWKKMTER